MTLAESVRLLDLGLLHRLSTAVFCQREGRLGSVPEAQGKVGVCGQGASGSPWMENSQEGPSV